MRRHESGVKFAHLYGMFASGDFHMLAGRDSPELTYFVVNKTPKKVLPKALAEFESVLMFPWTPPVPAQLQGTFLGILRACLVFGIHPP